MNEKAASLSAKTLSASVSEVGALFGTEAALIEDCANEILKSAPGQPHALMLLVSAKRLKGDFSGARELLQDLSIAHPHLASVQYELGLLLGEFGDSGGAIAAFSRVVELEPNHPNAWRALGDHLSKAGKTDPAGEAYGKHLEASASELEILDGAARLANDQLPMAEGRLHEVLRLHPSEVTARRLLAGVLFRMGRYQEAETHLARAVELAPDFSMARWMLAFSLNKRTHWEEALPHVEILLAKNPNDPNYLNLKAECLMRMGSFEDAAACLETLLSTHPTASNWMYYGHALKATSRPEETIAAYRKAITLKPDFGPAYWSLGNLKTFHFDSSEIDTMREMVERPELDRNSRSQMYFALGKALEDAKQYVLSFEHYQKGNIAWRKGLEHDPGQMSELVRRSKAVFTTDFFLERSGWGSPTSDPIFVVGLPRSGTSLIEQILASHSMVEGVGELTALRSVVERLADYEHTLGETYPEILRESTADEIQSGGDEYIARTRVFRKLRRPKFVDKMPSNFWHLGLLLLIMPNAKIIDARRHPLGCGFANFRQFYPEGQTFTFDLAEIGRYYRQYVEMMAHFDAVLSGRIHRVFYEQLVTDTDQEIRRLLDYCGLPFEESCLRFHETRRGVITASSEQVRKPIFTEALSQWRYFERWLDPLKSALGDVLSCYPQVPKFGEGAADAYPTKWGLSSQISARFVQ